MAYRHLFGPVPSRRLGASLGVDLVPLKVCSLNCVYCECGETTNLTVERREYVPFDSVTGELEHYFSNNPIPDFVTFSGSGEPTLHSRIGEVISFVKKISGVPVAVLTNGTLLNCPGVRSELFAADIVLPSLDAATVPAFRRINRPHPSLSAPDCLQGLRDFSREYTGRIWLEVFILPGYNDDRDNLESIRGILEEIKPDRIQLNTLDRPGAVVGLRPADPRLLHDIMDKWNLPGTEIIAPVSSRKENIAFRECTGEAILELINRRPCTLEDLGSILNLHANEINKYLATLEGDGLIMAVVMDRGVFYKAKQSV